MCSAFLTLREPWNITCSKRWAKPVLPGTSFFEPTAYQMLTATTGARWSSAMTRRRPLGRRSSVSGTEGLTMARRVPQAVPTPTAPGGLAAGRQRQPAGDPVAERADFRQAPGHRRIERLGRGDRGLDRGQAQDALGGRRQPEIGRAS